MLHKQASSKVLPNWFCLWDATQLLLKTNPIRLISAVRMRTERKTESDKTRSLCLVAHDLIIPETSDTRHHTN